MAALAAEHGGKVAATLRPLLPATVARALAFGPLAAFGALHWARMLEPAEPARVLICVAVALAAIPLLGVAGRLEGRRRSVVFGGLTLAALAVALLAAGVPARLLVPDEWEALAAGVWQGITTLPGVSIPYRGVEQWARWTLEAGGGLLVLGAALAAFSAGPGGGYRVAWSRA